MAYPTNDIIMRAERRWHIAHCMFYWQKYLRMRTTGAVMEERFDNVAHIKHCTKLVLNPVPDHRVFIEVPIVMNGSIESERGKGGHKHPGRQG